MTDNTISPYEISELNRIRNLCPSRERAEEVRRIALSIEGADQELLVSVADFLLEARQVLRGGKRDISGGRNWNIPDQSGP